MPRIPGFSAAWGVSLSNTAIVFGGLAMLALAWLTMNKQRPAPAVAMDDESQAQNIERDVLAYATDTQSAHANRDRIRAAINAVRDRFQVARDNYKKKLRDLIKARAAGTITQAQFRAQHEAALKEFHNAIKQRHLEIMHELGIPKYDANIADIVPTTT